jgi:hypothetical protein
VGFVEQGRTNPLDLNDSIFVIGYADAFALNAIGGGALAVGTKNFLGGDRHIGQRFAGG